MMATRFPVAQYAARTRSDVLRRISTSGGVFTELARIVMAKGGFVVGAGWRLNPFRAVLKVAHNEAELAEMRGAKYVWSGGVAGLNVGEKGGLFTGLPCQVSAARKLYGDKLIYCALICHSTPEPKVWESYVRYLECKYKSKLINVKFRSKEDGDWRHSKFVADFENNTRVVESAMSNDFVKAHFMGFSIRSACVNCRFKCGRHGADLVIGDFWGIEDVHPRLDDGGGVNVVLAFTTRGDELLRDAQLDIYPVKYEQALLKNPHLENNVIVDPRRHRMFMALYWILGVCIASRISRSRIGRLV